MNWRNTPRAQESFQAVGEAVADEFGESMKEAGGSPLSRGYVGTAVDDTTESIVIVVDPSLVDMQRLESELAAASGPGGVHVRVEASDVSAPDLLAAEQVIRARDWHPDAFKVGMALHLDPMACRFNVTFNRTDERVGHALQARLGDLVHIDWGTLRRRRVAACYAGQAARHVDAAGI
jgi:hypothetical protein